MTLICDMPEKDYRALPGLSGTDVAKILANPADLKWERDNPTPSTAAQSLGTLVHALVLDVDHETAVCPYPNYLTRAAKEWRAEMLADGRNICTEDDLERAQVMRDAVLANANAAALLDSPGASEVTITGAHGKAPLRGRIDRLPNVGPLIDLKTARDVSPRAMSRFMADYGTATQLAHYALLTGREEHRPYIIAVRNQGRPAVAVYQIGELTWLTALSATREAWETYAKCHATGEWPDTYAEGIGDLELSSWALDALEDIDMEVSL